MSNGDDESGAADDGEEQGPDGAGAEDARESGADADEDAAEEPEEPEEPEEITPEHLEERLDAAEEALDEAETEADLDEVEAMLDDVAADLEAADLPEPEDEDEDGPREQLEARLDGLRDDLEDARGPYAEDVVGVLEEVAATIRDTRWTETGERELVEAVDGFLDTAGESLDAEFDLDGEAPEALAATVEEVADAVANAGLDPDEDAETVEALLEAAETLAGDVEDAEEWDDLTVREQLAAQGFYDVITPENRKDFPPELTAVRVYESTNEPEPILLALDMLGSEFMEENCLNALKRMGPPEAFDQMHQRAQRRNRKPIEVLGKIGDDRAVETLVEFLGDEGNVPLLRVTLRALGEIGSEEATQAVANALASDNPEVRSLAARALGMIGDTRAIDPLVDALDGDEADEVRASAAWALVQIGTERALEAAGEYADDRSYLVQVQAEKAADAVRAA